MNVSLTPELEECISKKVGSGLYRSQSEVARQGLRLPVERDQSRAARMVKRRDEPAEGLEQARRGKLMSGEDLRNRIRDRSRERIS
jgi:antitoxin ParD1/3/4